MPASTDKYSQAVHELLSLCDWIDCLHPGLWAPPSAIQACLPWWRSYLRELIELGRVEERRYKLPSERFLRMASVHDVLAVVERSKAKHSASELRRRIPGLEGRSSWRTEDPQGGSPDLLLP